MLCVHVRLRLKPEPKELPVTRWLSSFLYASTLIGLAIVGAEGCGSEFASNDGNDAGGQTGDAAVPEDSGPGQDGGLTADGSVGSSDSGSDGGDCPSGQTRCAPCGGTMGACASVCPAIACVVDAGHPADASVGDAAACPPGQQRCSGCGTPFCGQVCPAIACAVDAAGPEASSDLCSPPCGPGTMCCSGGAPGTHTCVAPLTGGICPPLP
jgi:hypothetical protein